MPSSGPFFSVTDKASFDNAQAARINHEAQVLQRSDDLANAERNHLEALRMKTAVSGENSIHVGLTENTLGELYLDVGLIDDARTMLEAADPIRAGQFVL
tara:strand:+ start:1543 stop:1842 length:300 start_codon:yes stop_codon:yes gene_type:complete